MRTLGASSASIALVEPTSPAGVWAQRLTGLGAVVLPWLGLMRLRQAGAHPMPWLIAALLCGLVWLLVTASDHNRLAFDRKAKVGKQQTLLEGAEVYVLPSTSARARGAYPFEAQLKLWKAL